MKRYALIFAAFTSLSACSLGGVNSSSALPKTPGQALYAALGTYETVLHGAASYAQQPGADPKVIHTMNQINQAAETKATIAYAQAYIRCRKDTTQPGCLQFDFSPAALSANTALLRNIIIGLEAR